MDENVKVFIVHVASFILKMTIHLARKAQIALFILKKITVPAKYSDFANIFSKELAKMFSKYTGIKKYTIKLEKDK